MTDLTPLMRDALIAAHKAGPAGLRRTHDGQPGQPPWPAPPVTLHALTRRGLLERGTLTSRNRNRVDVWLLTEAGREALTTTGRLPRGYTRLNDGTVTDLPNRPRYPRDPGDHDRKPGPEPEQVRHPASTARARIHDEARRLSDIERAERARRLLTTEQRLADARRRAKSQHVDVSHELHVVRTMLARTRVSGREDFRAALTKLERIEARLDHKPKDIAA